MVRMATTVTLQYYTVHLHKSGMSTQHGFLDILHDTLPFYYWSIFSPARALFLYFDPAQYYLDCYSRLIIGRHSAVHR